MLNSVILMGRLTADPELRKTESGKSVTSFSIAVERNYAAKGQDRETDFFDIVAWNQTAEFITKYFGKGAMITVQGELRTRPYEAKDGSKRKSTEVQTDKAFFCGTKAASPATSKADSSEKEEPNMPEEFDDMKLPWEEDYE